MSLVPRAGTEIIDIVGESLSETQEILVEPEPGVGVVEPVAGLVVGDLAALEPVAVPAEVVVGDAAAVAREPSAVSDAPLLPPIAALLQTAASAPVRATASSGIAKIVSVLSSTVGGGGAAAASKPNHVDVFFTDKFKGHQTPVGHAESPERLDWVMNAVEKLRVQYPNHVHVRDDFAPVTVDHAAVKAAHARAYLERMRRRVPTSDSHGPLHATWASFSMGSIGGAMARTDTVVLQLPDTTNTAADAAELTHAGADSITVQSAEAQPPLPDGDAAASFVVVQPHTHEQLPLQHDDASDSSASTSHQAPQQAPHDVSQCASAAPHGHEESSASTSLMRQETVTDTFMSSQSWDTALLSAGAVCAAVDSVMSSTSLSKKVFVTCRPPGHHAARYGRGQGATSQGFCLLNNAAIGCLHATLAHNLDRVLVFDTDVHSGNGTISILGGLSKVLFAQILAPFDFLPDEDTTASLFGNVINVLLSENANKQASEMLRDLAPAFERVREFRPQLVIVSAGFDAHCADRVMNGQKGHLDQGDFERLFRLLTAVADEFCDGRLVATLEGGYSRRALQGGVAGMLTALLDADAKAERAARARIKRKRPDTKL